MTKFYTTVFCLHHASTQPSTSKGREVRIKRFHNRSGVEMMHCPNSPCNLLEKSTMTQCLAFCWALLWTQEQQERWGLLPWHQQGHSTSCLNMVKSVYLITCCHRTTAKNHLAGFRRTYLNNSFVSSIHHFKVLANSISHCHLIAF